MMVRPSLLYASAISNINPGSNEANKQTKNQNVYQRPIQHQTMTFQRMTRSILLTVVVVQSELTHYQRLFQSQTRTFKRMSEVLVPLFWWFSLKPAHVICFAFSFQHPSHVLHLIWTSTTFLVNQNNPLESG